MTKIKKTSKRPETKTGSIQNIFCEMLFFRSAGDTHKQPKVKHSFFSLVASGSVKVTTNDKETVFSFPHMIYIKANQDHIIESLEPSTLVYNVYTLRDKKTGNVVDPSTIPEGSSLVDYGIPEESL